MMLDITRCEKNYLKSKSKQTWTELWPKYKNLLLEKIHSQ